MPSAGWQAAFAGSRQAGCESRVRRAGDDRRTISRLHNAGQTIDGVEYERMWGALAELEDGLNVRLEYFDVESLRFLRTRYPLMPAAATGAIFFEQETTEQTECDVLQAWST